MAASLGGRFTFCLIAQIYFANYAAAGRATPAQASSLGWLFVHAGDLLGLVLWIVLEPLMLAQPAGLTAVSVGCIVVLVTVTMAVMGETSTFLRIPEAAKDRPHAHEKGLVSESLDVHGAMDQPGAPQPDAPAPAAAPTSAAPSEERSGARIDEIAQKAGLTPREAEVFALLAQGRSIPYIRDELIISRETAATHAKHIYAKLGVHSRQELIDLARR